MLSKDSQRSQDECIRVRSGGGLLEAAWASALLLTAGCHYVYGNYEVDESTGAAGGAAEQQARPCPLREYRCVDQLLEQCGELRWNLVDTCDSADLCNVEDVNAGRCDECAGSALRCDDSALQQCKEGAWTLLKICAEGETCDAERSGCSICALDDKWCDGAELMTCNAKRDGWVSNPCRLGCLTTPTAHCKDCTTVGETNCSTPSILRTCSEDWELLAETCSGGCIRGAPSDHCAP